MELLQGGGSLSHSQTGRGGGFNWVKRWMRKYTIVEEVIAQLQIIISGSMIY